MSSKVSITRLSSPYVILLPQYDLKKKKKKNHTKKKNSYKYKKVIFILLSTDRALAMCQLLSGDAHKAQLHHHRASNEG